MGPPKIPVFENAQPFLMEASSTHRISSIDLLRGLVMVLMLLDHTRDYFHFPSVSLGLNPMNPDQSSVAIYLTRWITHLCAPTFVALAGTSIYLQLGKSGWKPTGGLKWFLFSRGIWLIFLEITLINFAWTFLPPFQWGFLQVIWAIGISMVFLAALIPLGPKWILVLGIFIVCGHNLMDDWEPFDNETARMIWAVVHHRGSLRLPGGWELRAAYPFLPWLGIMMVGFGAGPLFRKTVSPDARFRTLIGTGLALILAFTLLRMVNGYGDPKPWTWGSEGKHFWFGFFDVQKYPPSMLYGFIMLGIGCLLLAVFEKGKMPFRKILLAFGQVPFFFYILHLFLIHCVAVLVYLGTGGSWVALHFNETFGGLPEGFGFGLAGVCLFWLGFLAILYPVCAWFSKVKSANKGKWWTGYI